MAKYTDFIKNYNKNLGSIELSYGPLGSIFEECADGIYLQSEFPDLFNSFGYHQDIPDHEAFTSWVLSTVSTNASLYSSFIDDYVYIVCGTDSTLETSTNGIVWTARNSNLNQIKDIVYGNGLYLITENDDDQYSISTDAINWVKRTTGNSNLRFNTLSYGGGLFFGSGTDTSYLAGVSTDAINWSTSTVGKKCYSSYYGNGLYLFACEDCQVKASTNIINWTSSTVDPGKVASSVEDIIYPDNNLCLVNVNNSLYTSTDTINWTVRTSLGININSLGYYEGLYLVGGSNGELYTSTDTINWTARTSGATSTIYNIAAYKGEFLFSSNSKVGLTSIYSYNGKTEFLLPREDSGILTFKNKTFIKSE